MDMNWQAMLHEAANASFEKDIEVRSAADDDAYSCIDLPKAKLRELSEKILHLPHQGIILLFSRNGKVLPNEKCKGSLPLLPRAAFFKYGS